MQGTHRLRAVARDIDRVVDSLFLEGDLDELDIVAAVIDEKNRNGTLVRFQSNLFGLMAFGVWIVESWSLVVNPGKYPRFSVNGPGAGRTNMDSGL